MKAFTVLAIDSLYNKRIFNSDFTCRDTARSHLMIYVPAEHRYLVSVFFAGITEDIARRTVEHVQRVPQYRDMQFAVDSTKGPFNRESYGVRMSGPELYHAFYWVALILRASLRDPDWKTVPALLRGMEPNDGVHWGLKTDHIKAWRRVMRNQDVSSAEMRRMSQGPINAYNLQARNQQVLRIVAREVDGRTVFESTEW